MRGPLDCGLMVMSLFRIAQVATLCILGAFPDGAGAQQVSLTGPHWRVVSSNAFPTVVAYDTTRVKLLSPGRFDLWQRYTLHPPRVDPDGVVATVVLHVVVDCGARQTALRLAARYDKAGTLIKQTAEFSAGQNDFADEPPGSVEESALTTICSELATRRSHS